MFQGLCPLRAVKMPTGRLKCCGNRVSDNCFVLFLETLRPCDKNNATGYSDAAEKGRLALFLFLAQQPSAAKQIRCFTVSATERKSGFSVTETRDLLQAWSSYGSLVPHFCVLLSLSGPCLSPSSDSSYLCACVVCCLATLRVWTEQGT